MAREGQTPTPSGDLDVFGKELPLTCECLCVCVRGGRDGPPTVNALGSMGYDAPRCESCWAYVRVQGSLQPQGQLQLIPAPADC